MSSILKSVVAISILFIAAVQSDRVMAQALTRLAGPGGGDVVYGGVSGAQTVPAAMGAVLKTLHIQFGARPEVGRVFEVRNSNSSALYFGVQPPNGPPVAGMVIVTPMKQGGYQAGLVVDERTRIATSFNPLMQTLLNAWHPNGEAQADMGNNSGANANPGANPNSNANASANARSNPNSGTNAGLNVGPNGGGHQASAPPAPLRPFMLPDQSASVGLPEGWQVDRHSGGGTIFANGPNGEFAALGSSYLVIDNGSAQGRRLQQQALGPLRNTSYATALYYPFGTISLARTYVDLNRMQRERAHAEPAPIRVDSETPMGGQAGGKCALVQGETGAFEGHGPLSLNTIFCVAAPVQGSWMALAYQVSAPIAIADRQRATLIAIRASFQQNDAVIQRQAAQYAAPGIAAIREIGRQATIRAAQADETRISMRQSYEARSAVQDRSNQAFSNYMRDQTTIVDRDNNTHGTLWNQTADSLVRNDPQRYGYVDTPGFWKGVDY